MIPMAQVFTDIIVMADAVIDYGREHNYSNLVFVEDMTSVGFLFLDGDMLFKVDRKDAFNSLAGCDKAKQDLFLPLIFPDEPHRVAITQAMVGKITKEG